jgi:nickel-type superoxide dismutase maturation protease
MSPTLVAGDRVVVLRVPRRWPLRPGDLVALAHPGADASMVLVKRVAGLGEGWVDVRGDNAAASTDSRDFGPVPRASVRGLVPYRYGPPGRTGWLASGLR